MEQTTLSNPILQLTAATFESEVIQNETPILIDFWAPWCGPCRAMKPILSDAAKLLAGKVRVAQVNVDEEPELAGAFGIQSIPTCYLMKGNRAIGSIVGLMPAQELVSQIMSKVNSA